MIGGFPSTQTRLLYFIVACGYGARKGLLSLAGSPMALSRGIEFLIAGGMENGNGCVIWRGYKCAMA